MESCGNCRKTVVSQYHFCFNLVPAYVILFSLLVQLTPFAQAAAYPFGTMLTSKRIAFPIVTEVSADDGYPDYHSRVRYDEYPIVVPKRAALILDRILKEIESAKDNNQLINDWSPAFTKAWTGSSDRKLGALQSVTVKAPRGEHLGVSTQSRSISCKATLYVRALCLYFILSMVYTLL